MTQRHPSRRQALLATLALPLLPACGGGGGTAEPLPPPPAGYTVQGRYVRRVQANATGWAALEETPAPYAEASPPVDRRIHRAGTGFSAQYAPPPGWSLIDMALHPSGELSAVLATQAELRLLRLDAQLRTLSDVPLRDPASAQDPYYDYGGVKGDDSALQPRATRDAVRLASLGEDLVVALRSGRHAVVAYRYAHTAQGYVQLWRNLVEPGTTVLPRFLAGGSHDTYGQLINHFQVLVAANAAGEIAVAVPASHLNAAFEAHYAHFPSLTNPVEGPTPALQGALVTRLTGQGRRIDTAAFVTDGPAQTYALRALDDGAWGLAGRQRVATPPDSRWSGFVARLTAGAVQHYGVHVERDDVLFDLAPLPGGRALVAGATGYQQNPQGASISDQAAPLLAVLGTDGQLQRLPTPPASQQNPVFSLAAQDERWLAGGMLNGPGTHTADGDPTRLRADGYVREVAVGP